MSKIAELPENEKPRDKALRFGMRSLSNRELVALLLRTGVRGKSVLETAEALILEAGGIGGLARMDLQEMMKTEGIGPVKALQIQACFELARRSAMIQVHNETVIDSPEKIAEWLKAEIGASMQEQFMAVYLDTGHHIIASRTLFVGTIDTSLVYPREIFRYALLCSSTDIMLVHNHPGGSLQPSMNDIDLTGRLIKAGRLMGVHVLDHIIVTQTGFFSFAREQLIEECFPDKDKQW